MVTRDAWKPEAGRRAWWVDSNVDVLRTYKDTATIQCWGAGMLEGQRVTYRGIRLDTLSQPRKRLGADDAGKPVYEAACEHCGQPYSVGCAERHAAGRSCA